MNSMKRRCGVCIRRRSGCSGIAFEAPSADGGRALACLSLSVSLAVTLTFSQPVSVHPDCPSVPGPHVQLSVCESTGCYTTGGAALWRSVSHTSALSASLHSRLCVCPTAVLAHAAEVTPPTLSVSLLRNVLWLTRLPLAILWRNVTVSMEIWGWGWGGGTFNRVFQRL